MMRRASIVIAVLAAASSVALARPAGPPHRPTLPGPYVCKVSAREGGGICTTTPYPRLGASCTCEGDNGPRHGVVSTR